MFSFSIFIYFRFHRDKYMYPVCLSSFFVCIFFYFYFIYLFFLFSCWQVHVLLLCMCYLFLRRHALNMYLLSYRVRGHQVTFVPKYPDPEVIKYLSCLTQLSLKIFLLINVKMPTSYLSLKKTKLLIFLYL